MDKLPPGFRFAPTDRELIEDYLRPRVMGSKIPCDIVKERRIYGPDADPWIVFPESDESWMQDSSEEKVMYVFVKLTRKAADPGSGKSKKKKKLESHGREHHERKAGCGTWHGEITNPQIVVGGKAIGQKRMFKFEVNEIPQGYDQSNFVVNYYKMHEYSLLEFRDIVLCKITLDHSKKAAFDLRPVNNVNAQKNQKEISGRGHKGCATQRFSSENNYVGESCSMVSVCASDQQIEGRLILHNTGDEAHRRMVDNHQRFDGITSDTCQNINGDCGSEGGLLNNTGQLEYDYRVEEQVSDQGFHGAPGDNFQCSNGDQTGITNNSLVEIDEVSSRVPEYLDPFDDEYLMDILGNCDEFACYDDEFFNDNQQQPLQAEQQPVQNNNAQQLVEDNVQQSVQSSSNLGKRKFEGQSCSKKRQQYCKF